MIGLIYENFLILKKQILMASILLILSLIPSIMINDYIFFIFSTILISMLPITAFVYENDSKMIKVLLSMPINRKTFITSKYLSTLLLCLIGFIMNFVYMFIRSKNLLVSFVLSLLCFIIGTTLMNVMFPLVFKYGVEKAKFLLVCIMIFLGFIGFYIYKLIPFLPTISTSTIILICIFIYFFIYIISYLLSIKFYSKIEII